VAYDADGRPLFIQGVGFDVTDLKNAEESLKRKNEDLGQFAYAASHDLREPLRMIASFTQLLEKKYGDKFDGESRAWLSEIVRGAQRARSLVDSLLTYARIDEVRPVEPVDFNDLLKDVLSNLTVAISESRAKITSDRLPLVRGRRTDLSRLLQNLLENALKFRAPDRAPAIHVTAKAQGIEWVFSVRDNGIGIDPQYFPKLFKVFQRLHLPSEYRGEGIGLAMARKIVEGHGGRIWVESREGEGATFFFTLPRAGQE
jgi:light-regulated signal transduction histidine kinase (bacteriophytochrome)